MRLLEVTITTIITITCGSCRPDELPLVQVPPEAAAVHDPAVRPWVVQNHAGTVLRRGTMRANSALLPPVNPHP